MDIHKPKPVRNWHEFLKEYAIIVVGVLTALAAEQAVENWRDHRRAQDARGHIHAEIASDLVRLRYRAATEDCITRRLDDVKRLIAASTAGNPPKQALWIGTPLAYAMLDGRYKAATQSGAVSLFDDQEQADYAALYGYFSIYYELTVAEQRAWADLRMLEETPPASAALDAQLRSAFKQATFNRFYIRLLQLQIIQRGGKAGVAVPAIDKMGPQSVCLPLTTPRAQAVKMLMREPRFDQP